MPEQDLEQQRARWREASRRYRRAHPEKISAANAAYSRANAPALRANRRVRDQEHRAEQSARMKEWRARNPDKSRRNRRRYVLTHTAQVKAGVAAYRARKYGAAVCDLSAAQWQEIKAAYGSRCVYCGRKMQRLTQDHLTPLRKGGNHTASNVVPACQSCNNKKYTGAPLIAIQPLLLTMAPAQPVKKRRKR